MHFFNPLQIFIAILMCTLGTHVHAAAYRGPAGEKVFIESVPELGSQVFLIKIEGTNSKWDHKILRTTRLTTPIGNWHGFSYLQESSHSEEKTEHQIVADVGFVLIRGNYVNKIQLSCPESNSKPVQLIYDERLSKKSFKSELLAEYRFQL